MTLSYEHQTAQSSQTPKKSGFGVSYDDNRYAPSTLIQNAPTHTDTSGNGYKRSFTYRQWRNEVTEALYLCGLDDEAEAFGNCAEFPVRWQSPHDKVSRHDTTAWVCRDHMSEHDAAIFCATCDNRCCPDCAARQSARFIARYIPPALELGLSGGRYRIRHIVMTTPIALTSDTPEKIRKIYRDYSKLPRKALEIVQKRGEERGRSWSTLGAIQSAEFGSEGEKLHFHIIQYGDYIPQSELSDAWSQVTNGQAYVCRVYSLGNDEQSLTSSIIEALKYSTKFWSKDDKTGDIKYLPANIIPHLMQVLKSTRRVKSWGFFYNIPAIETEPMTCKDCGAEMYRLGVEELIHWQAMVSSLSLKLANKSASPHAHGNKSPPKKVSKQVYPDQLPLSGMPEITNQWQYE